MVRPLPCHGRFQTGSTPVRTAIEGCQSGLSNLFAKEVSVTAPQVRILYPLLLNVGIAQWLSNRLLTDRL